jgi:dTDP-4-amino-4,6-dideoxygalactose transaminase
MIPLFHVNMPPREHLMPALEDTLYSGYVTQGKKVDEFEELLGQYVGNPRVLTVNSGTSALQLALRLCRIRAKNVVTTPMTCSATALPIPAEYGYIRWADIDRASGNIDPESVERELNSDCGAILATHWGGTPCDMDALANLAETYHVPLIIDAAHALGSKWDGGMTGNTVADYTCFSFQAIKHITTGDGGLLCTATREDWERGKRLRWFGIDREKSTGDARVDTDIPEYGYKFHMNDIDATMGIAQMHYLPSIVRKHQDNAAYYDQRFACGGPARQAVHDKADSSWWLYTLIFDSPEQRISFMQFMKKRGIQVSRVHARLDKLRCFATVNAPSLPGLDWFYERECCIPVHAGLSEYEREAVADAVLEFMHS